MKLIIDIDEDVRIAISRMGLLRIPDEMQKKVDKAIQSGTPLPKGHGRLIDADELLKQQDGGEWNGVGFSQEYVYSKTIKNATTIIEADKESEG